MIHRTHMVMSNRLMDKRTVMRKIMVMIETVITTVDMNVVSQNFQEEMTIVILMKILNVQVKNIKKVKSNSPLLS